MALNPGTKYPGRITAPDPNYSYGSSKNATAPGADDGTPYEKDRANDIFGFQQALLKSASIVPNGASETEIISQYLHAILELASGRAYTYDDNGIADAYVLDVQANQQGIKSYFDNMRCEFIAANNNTGAATARVSSLAVVPIVEPNGSAIVVGRIISGQKIQLAYSVAFSAFVILSSIAVIQKRFYIKSNTNIIVPQGVSQLTAIVQGAGGGGGGGADGGTANGVSDGGPGGNSVLNYNGGAIIMTSAGGSGGKLGLSSAGGLGGVTNESTIDETAFIQGTFVHNGQDGLDGAGVIGGSGGADNYAIGGKGTNANKANSLGDGINGGGGAGGYATDFQGAGGGGASANTLYHNFAVTPGDSINMTIGVGGIPGIGVGSLFNFEGYAGGNGFISLEFF